MEAMDDSTSTDSGNFHVVPWMLPLASMEANLLPPTCMEVDVFTSKGSFHES